jgi:cysteine desulfurase/selenocysteine lyase
MPLPEESHTTEDVLSRHVRERFPALRAAADVLFLDNASTTQKPEQVIATIEAFYRTDCANAGRAIYPSALRAAQCIEKARCDAARLINADPAEVAFTTGATDSLNAVAFMWGLQNLEDGDEVMVCLQDHKAAVEPWQLAAKTLARFGKKITVKTFDIHPVGDYDFRSIRAALSERTRVVALAHIHHVFGVDMEINEIRRIVGAQVIISLDASQSIAHTKVDAQSLDVDFISFSGHKAFAGNGVGVLFARKSRHAELAPLRGGGHSTALSSDINADERMNFIDKVEVGTLNIPAIASLSSAIDFIEEIGIENIESHVSALTSLLVEKLKPLPGVIFAPGPVTCGCPGGFGILSFRFEHVSSFDLASALANEQIHVRSGDHCRAGQRQYHDAGSDGFEDFIRVSMQVYNTPGDVDTLAHTLEELVS